MEDKIADLGAAAGANSGASAAGGASASAEAGTSGDAFTAEYGTVLVSVDDHLAHVELNRPDTLNSLTREMFADLVDAGSWLCNREDVTAVVITGRGKGFCSGLDMSEFSKMASGEARASIERNTGGPAKALAQQAVFVWQQVEAPVIAGIKKVAFGGGLQLALGADLRIADPEAKLSMMEINWGIAPDMCGTQMLPRVVGAGRAKRMIFTGEVVSGAEAERIGLIEEVAEDPVARALELGRELADKSRSALVGAKMLVDMSGRASLADAFAAEQQVIRSLIGGEEQKIAIAKRMKQLGKK